MLCGFGAWCVFVLVVGVVACCVCARAMLCVRLFVMVVLHMFVLWCVFVGVLSLCCFVCVRLFRLFVLLRVGV